MTYSLVELWDDLESARANELHINPWDSSSDEVQRIWSLLTAPERLTDLLDWQDAMAPLNPVAQQVVTKAIEASQSRQSDQANNR